MATVTIEQRRVFPKRQLCRWGTCVKITDLDAILGYYGIIGNNNEQQSGLAIGLQTTWRPTRQLQASSKNLCHLPWPPTEMRRRPVRPRVILHSTQKVFQHLETWTERLSMSENHLVRECQTYLTRRHLPSRAKGSLCFYSVCFQMKHTHTHIHKQNHNNSPKLWETQGKFGWDNEHWLNEQLL